MSETILQVVIQKVKFFTIVAGLCIVGFGIILERYENGKCSEIDVIIIP